MGRQKGRHLRVTAKSLVEGNPGFFSNSFEENKKKIVEMGLLKESVEERNKLAGQVTNLVKKASSQGGEEKAVA